MLSHTEKLVTPPTSYVEQSRRPRGLDCNLNLQVNMHVQNQSISEHGNHCSKIMKMCRNILSISDSHSEHGVSTWLYEEKKKNQSSERFHLNNRKEDVSVSPWLKRIKTPPWAEPNLVLVRFQVGLASCKESLEWKYKFDNPHEEIQTWQQILLASNRTRALIHSPSHSSPTQPVKVT